MQVGFFNGTTGSASSGKTQETLNQEEKTVNTYILRLRNPIEDVIGFEEYVWPDGSDNATWVDEKLGNERRSKIGTGDRSEKIRTYNYPQNRVTDHRIGFTTKNLDRVMEGNLEEIIEALITEDQNRKLRGE